MKHFSGTFQKIESNMTEECDLDSSRENPLSFHLILKTDAMVEEKGVYIYANLLDLNEDGKIDMISFLDPQGRGIAVAVDRASDGDMDHIHVFQDVTGDGKLDMDDTRLIEREALKLFRQEGLEEGQLKLFVEDGAYG